MLSGELVNLRALEPDDIDNVMSWVNDREVTQWLSGAFSFPMSKMAEKEWLEKASKSPDAKEKVLVIETKDGTYIGSVGLHRINMVDGVAELGIVIGRKDYWGKGYGTDAARTMLKWGFSNLRLRKAFLRVLGQNERGIASYKKLGFKQVGCFKQNILKDGIYVDEVLMELFAEELA